MAIGGLMGSAGAGGASGLSAMMMLTLVPLPRPLRPRFFFAASPSTIAGPPVASFLRGAAAWGWLMTSSLAFPPARLMADAVELFACSRYGCTARPQSSEEPWAYHQDFARV